MKKRWRLRRFDELNRILQSILIVGGSIIAIAAFWAWYLIAWAVLT